MPDLIPHDLFDEPFLPMRRLRRLLEEPFSGWPGWDTDGNLALDVYRDEEQGAVVAKASMPGFDRDEIEISIDDGVLAIRGEHQEEQETNEDKYFRRERRVGVVQRRVALPASVQEDNAKAELKDGVLTVTVPLAAETQPKRVEIQVS